MTDNSGKTCMAIGETDDLTAIIESFIADADITKGDPVYLSADDQVTPAGAAQDCIGIAMETVADTEPVPVLIRGRVKVAAGGAITRGKAVYGADSSHRVLMLTDVSQADQQNTLSRCPLTKNSDTHCNQQLRLEIFCSSRSAN
jgi:hypothetical protein